jgi:hypothetical protein
MGRRHWRRGLTGPDQHLAILVDGQTFGIDQFGFQVLQVFRIQVEPPPEGAVRHPPLTLKQIEHLVENLVKGHRQPSPAGTAAMLPHPNPRPCKGGGDHDGMLLLAICTLRDEEDLAHGAAV